MSLAPTVYTERAIAPGAGLILALGLAANLTSNVVSPARAAPVVEGRAPTVTIGLGPVAQPSRATWTIAGLQPGLGRELRIYPRLPEGEGVSNTLTPTILLGSSDFAGTPAVGYAKIEGRPPVLVLDGSTTIELSGALYPVNVQGLAPTIVLPPQFEGFKTPRAGSVEFTMLAPTVFTERRIENGVASPPVLSGLRPTLVTRYVWQTVALGGEAVWTEDPPAY